jgi:hypothetical protein
MKITVDIDCTPEEARAFLGLPDVSPLHDVMLKEIEQRMREAMKSMDPDSMASVLSMGMPASLKGFEALQNSFWTQMMGKSGASVQKEPSNKNDNTKSGD